MKARYHAPCARCYDEIEPKQDIERAPKMVRVVIGWYDYGARKGETKYGTASYQHITCPGNLRREEDRKEVKKSGNPPSNVRYAVRG